MKFFVSHLTKNEGKIEAVLKKILHIQEWSHFTRDRLRTFKALAQHSPRSENLPRCPVLSVISAVCY